MFTSLPKYGLGSGSETLELRIRLRTRLRQTVQTVSSSHPLKKKKKKKKKKKFYTNNHLRCTPVLCSLLALLSTKTLLRAILGIKHAQLKRQAPVMAPHHDAFIHLPSRSSVFESQPPISVVPLDRHQIPPLRPFRHSCPLKPAHYAGKQTVISSCTYRKLAVTALII
jgi:hypothetical protein